jgi:hypothetical protein
MLLDSLTSKAMARLKLVLLVSCTTCLVSYGVYYLKKNICNNKINNKQMKSKKRNKSALIDTESFSDSNSLSVKEIISNFETRKNSLFSVSSEPSSATSKIKKHSNIMNNFSFKKTTNPNDNDLNFPCPNKNFNETTTRKQSNSKESLFITESIKPSGFCRNNENLKTISKKKN